jgi:arylsulfatase A-like enzyme
MRHGVIGVFMLLFCTAVSSQVEHVVIAVIDGARYSETFGDSTHHLIPRLWNELRPQGTILTALYNQGETKTNPSHCSILSGQWERVDNYGHQRPHFPTIFEKYRAHHRAPRDRCAVILGKKKLDILAFSSSDSLGKRWGATVYAVKDSYNDSLAFVNACEVLEEHAPAIALVNFPQTDAAGHSGQWERYAAALRGADEFVYRLWGFIQVQPRLRDKTLLIVTNDHGRHSDNFAEHGDGCEGCRHVMGLLLGPVVKQGAVDGRAHTLLDISVTVGAVLGFPVEAATGSCSLLAK